MAEKSDLGKVIQEIPMFKGIAPEFLSVIVNCGSNVRFEDGQTIFREGEPANTFYALRHGRVAVQIYTPQRGAVTIQTLHEGDILGWSWLFPPYRTMFDAKCLTLVRALAFDAECLRSRCEQNVGLGYDLMKRFAQVMTQRVRAARLQVLDVYGNVPSA